MKESDKNADLSFSFKDRLLSVKLTYLIALSSFVWLLKMV